MVLASPVKVGVDAVRMVDWSQVDELVTTLPAEFADGLEERAVRVLTAADRG